MSYPQFIYYAHHKCASSWINRFIWKVTAKMGKPFISYNSDEQAGGDIFEACQNNKYEVLTIRNSRWNHCVDFGNTKGIHVIRDPRDVIVSGYFSHLKTHQLIVDEMRVEREQLQKLNKEEGIIYSMTGMNGKTLNDMGRWKYGTNDCILELRLEEMSPNPTESLKEIIQYAGWYDDKSAKNDPLNKRLKGVINEIWRRTNKRSLLCFKEEQISYGNLNRSINHVQYEKLAGGRQVGEVDKNSHYRSGKHGDWVNHFTPAIEAAFKENFPNLVSKLGYEKNENWTAFDTE
ncbi:MAG: sulfotransferase domain-containing protein [Akkermansiaceae bacterium]